MAKMPGRVVAKGEARGWPVSSLPVTTNPF
jgi:hypothetical protein